MSVRARSRLFALLIYIAFFCSGAASLVAEVTWNRMLIVVVGNSLSATAMIVAVFMGGLGLGSYLGGRWVRDRRITLKPYLLLEIVIGLFVVVSPWLFGGLAGLFANLASGGINQGALALVRILVTLAALVLPATLMGATFPIIVAGTALNSSVRRTARTGYLYSTNTLGAAIGCFAAGYHLLLEFGVQVTLNVSLGLYVTAALSALVANAVAGRRDAAAENPAPASEEGSPAPVSLRRYLLFATFVVGLVSLSYEVLLTRMSILFLGNSVSVFPLVLTAFLLGTGLSAVVGTWLYGRLRRMGAGADRLFGILALLAALFMLLTPYLLLSDRVVGPDHYARFADAAPLNPLPILGVLILPLIMVGAMLPVAIRMLNPRSKGETARSAANLYALNTMGGLLGAALGNHFLVPLVGIQWVLIGMAGVLVLMAAAGPLIPGRGKLKVALPLGVTLAVVLVLNLLLPPIMHQYALKVAQATGARSARVKLVREGKAATVTVIDQADPRLGTYRDMYLNGVEEASTRYWHVQLFKLLGVLPPLIHEPEGPKDAMVIAFGAGITAGSVLASDQVASLDVADLNPDIEGINDLFTEVNGDVFHKDRFHFHNEDGRNYLLTSGKEYDLIISDSTHPRAYDSWILYTEEFYNLVKRRLKPGGIFAQWVPVTGSMRGELMRIHLNTFRTVFPHTTVWYIYGSDQAFLLATPEPLQIDAAQLRQRLDRLPEWFQADYFDIDTVPHVAGFFWMDGPALDAMLAGETRINTDDVHYFDKQSAVWPLPQQWQLPAFQANALPYFRGLDRADMAAIRQEQEVAGHVSRYTFYNNDQELHDAFCLDATNGNARYFMGLATGGRIPDPDVFCAEQEIARYRRMLDSHPDNALAMNALASVLCDAGRCDEALPLARRATQMLPENGMIRDTLGWALLREGQFEAAVAELKKSDELLPDHPIVTYHLAVAYQELGRHDRAAELLKDCLALDPEHPERERIEEILGTIER